METIRLVDQQLLRILNVLEDLGGTINLILFSDHGMAERVGGRDDGQAGLVNVLDYVSANDWDHAYGSKTGPVLQIWPKAGKLEAVRKNCNAS